MRELQTTVGSGEEETIGVSGPGQTAPPFQEPRGNGLELTLQPRDWQVRNGEVPCQVEEFQFLLACYGCGINLLQHECELGHKILPGWSEVEWMATGATKNRTKCGLP